MEKKELLKNLSKLGFSLLEPDEHVDVNSVLYQVLKSKEARFLAGFPALLTNTAKYPDFDYKSVVRLCEDKKDRELLYCFTALSLSVYKYFKLKFWWADKMLKSLTRADKKLVNVFLTSLKNSEDLKVMEYSFSAEHVKSTFQNYFSNDVVETRPLRSNYEELSFEFALSQVFSPKQKALFFKKLRSEKMTKTEQEYYSRKVKKKVVALSNLELHNLAKRLLTS